MDDNKTQDAPQYEKQQLWAKDWLNRVADARKAMERAPTILKMRREKAYGLPAHIEPDVIQMVDTEEEIMADYKWADQYLKDFDLMAEINRPQFKGDMLLGLDIAEAKYRLGYKLKDLEGKFCLSQSALYRSLGAFIDYLDYIGPHKAFGIPLEEYIEAIDHDEEDDASPVLMDYMPETPEECVAYLEELSKRL